MNAPHTLPLVQKTIPQGLIAKGKASVQLYKTGVLNTWRNRQASRDILKRYGVQSSTALSQSIVENSHLKSIQDHHGNMTTPKYPGISRSDFLTVLRYNRDWYKLPGFAVIFAICFEMTPLVLWAAPRLSPYTCFSRPFIEKLRKNYTEDSKTLREISATESLDGSLSAYRLPEPVLRQLAKTIIHHQSPFLHQYLPTSWLRQKLVNHMTEVKADDDLLRQGNLQELDEEEIFLALMARGLPLDAGINGIEKWLHTFKEPMDMAYFITAGLTLHDADGRK